MGAGGSSSIPGILLAALLAPSLAVRAAERPPPAAPPEFCASLARVMAAATAGIETLRGRARENGEWEATEALPGLHDCVIETNQPNYDAPLYSYSCVVSKPKGAAAADADQERLRRQVSQCLGDSWQTGEIQHPASHSLFFTKQREPTVQLTNLGSGNYGHEVGLSVYPPTVSIILKAPAGKVVDLDAPIDIKAKDETARTIFSAVAKALGASSFVDAETHGRATLERKDVPLREALDAVCAQAGCTWSLNSGEQGLELWLKRKES